MQCGMLLKLAVVKLALLMFLIFLLFTVLNCCLQLALSNFQESLFHLLYLLFEPKNTFICRHCVFVSQARLDGYQRQMEQDVSEMVSRTRSEGVDRIIKLKKKYGCTNNSEGLTLTQSKVQEGRKQEFSFICIM